jgi:hypothetical protein
LLDGFLLFILGYRFLEAKRVDESVVNRSLNIVAHHGQIDRCVRHTLITLLDGVAQLFEVGVDEVAEEVGDRLPHLGSVLCRCAGEGRGDARQNGLRDSRVLGGHTRQVNG